jgi:hypothetical protein
MSETWQHVIVTIVAVAAAAWIVRDIRRRRAAKAACDGCALMRPPKS